MNGSNSALEGPCWNQRVQNYTAHTHISGQEHQNEKNDEKKHEECYDHDLPPQAGLLHDHCHPFLHTNKWGRRFRLLKYLSLMNDMMG
jgi:hypothetical protein